MADQRLDRRRILTGAGALGAFGTLAALLSQTPVRADDEDEHRRSLIGAWEFTATISVGAAATPTGTPMPMRTATGTPMPLGTATSTSMPLGTPTGSPMPTGTATGAPMPTGTPMPMGPPTGTSL